MAAVCDATIGTSLGPEDCAADVCVECNRGWLPQVDAEVGADELAAGTDPEPTEEEPLVGVLGAEQVICPGNNGVVGLLRGVEG